MSDSCSLPAAKPCHGLRLPVCKFHRHGPACFLVLAYKLCKIGCRLTTPTLKPRKWPKQRRGPQKAADCIRIQRYSKLQDRHVLQSEGREKNN